MKITILGAGSAGCFTALYFSHYTDDTVEVELIHDPDILPTPVGQATLLLPPVLLWDTFQFNWHNNPIDAVPKTGILYEGWGKKKDKIFHPFPFGSTGMHFSPSKLQEYVLNAGKKLFKVTESKVEDCTGIDSDYIIDCRGTPTNWEEYDFLENPLNSVLISQKEGIEGNNLWTRSVATPDGWAFMIPQTSNSTSVGYLYNHSITSEGDAVSNFRDMFGIEEITTKLKFNNYIAKQPVIGDRVILNGNRLFFIEPLEATSIETHLEWCRYIRDWIIGNKFDGPVAVEKIKTYIEEVKSFILWHYQFGSKYNTPFWDYAKSFKIKDGMFHRRISTIGTPEWHSNEFSPSMNFVDFGRKAAWNYGQWEPWNFKMWHEGVV